MAFPFFHHFRHKTNEQADHDNDNIKREFSQGNYMRAKNMNNTNVNARYITSNDALVWLV